MNSQEIISDQIAKRFASINRIKAEIDKLLFLASTEQDEEQAKEAASKLLAEIGII